MELTGKNSKIAAKEAAEAKERLEREKEEIDYLEGLKKDSNFQKYIVEKRIKSRIAQLNSLDGISMQSLDFERVGKMAMINKLVKDEVEDMLKDLL